MHEEAAAGTVLSIAPNRDVLLMSSELRGRVADIDDDAGSEASIEELGDATPMVVVQRTATDGSDDTIIGKLQRVKQNGADVHVALRTSCEQALSVLEDSALRTERAYGATVIDAAPGIALVLAKGPPSSVELEAVTPAGICTLVLSFSQ